SRAVNVRGPTRILSMPNTNRPTISTHVLDTTRGEPAAGVAVTLWRLEGSQHVSQGTSETDADGRIAQLGDGQVTAGTYRLSFEVAPTIKGKGPPPSCSAPRSISRSPIRNAATTFRCSCRRSRARAIAAAEPFRACWP